MTADVTKGGHKQFITGDPVIDKLEKDLAEGKEPDLDAAFPNADHGFPKPADAPTPVEFDDDYAAGGSSPTPATPVEPKLTFGVPSNRG